MASGLPAGGVRYFRKYLFDIPLGENDFSKGIIRDVPRWSIPAGGAYRLDDVLVNSPGVVTGRGGSRNYGTAISITGGATPFTNTITCPNFSAGPKVFCISDKGDGSNQYISDITSGSASGTTAISIQPRENPPFGQEYVIVTDASGGVVPKRVARDLTITALDSSAPKGTCSAFWGSYLVLANDNASHLNRIWFSTANDITAAWDSGSAEDLDRPIIALVVVQGNLLIFTRTSLTRMGGGSPPTTAGGAGDLTFQKIATIGTIDARSVVVVGDMCYFANEDGVYATDGTSVDSITTRPDNSGIASLWTSETAGLSPYSGTGVISAGQWQNKYLIYSIHNTASAADWMHIYYIPSGAWVNVTNTKGLMFATSVSPSEKLFMASKDGGDSTHSMVIDLTNFWKPENGVTDFNSTKVTGLIETRALVGNQMGLKRFGQAHVTYYLPNSSDVMTVKFAAGMDGTLTFANVDEGSAQPQASSISRNRFHVNRDAQAMTLRFQQTTSNDVWDFYGFELEAGDFFVADGQ